MRSKQLDKTKVIPFYVEKFEHKIEINGKYTYNAGDISVKIGDIVILPSASWLRDVSPTWQGTVTAINVEYSGWCEKIISVK